MFASKKELLKSLPAISASDFIIYDTSAQDATKPYVLVSFSFFDEKVGSYNYQVYINKTLGNFIKEVYRSSGSSGYTGIYMADVRTYYYDAITSEWVLNQAAMKGQSVSYFLGLKGSIETIIYSTRDVYVDSTTFYKKDSRFLLSGRFRNETPFDEFFNEEHLAELNYEVGDDLLRLKYADNHHALFVIKGANTPLSTHFNSHSSYYSLSSNGTLTGLVYKDAVYTPTNTLTYVSNNRISFDDYVLYSTLDITYENRIMRLKDNYITGTRDEIIAINGLDRVQIDIPHEGYEVITNPDGLPVECLTEIPETFTTVDSYIAQFRAGNSYAYEHYFETIDELEKWYKFPLPEKQVIADFDDGNDYRVIYQSAADKTCQMLTFSMEEGCDLYWGNNSYAYWYFTDKTKASNFKLYSLSKEGIGEATTVDWYSSSSSYNYLKTTVKAYKRDIECIFFINTPLLHSDKSTVLVEEMSFDWLSNTYFHFRNIRFNPEARVKVGESWESHVEVIANQSANITYKSLTFEGDYQSVYDKHGSYVITANLVVEQYPDKVFTTSFLLNIHENELTFNYPNIVPFPIEDGMKTFVVFKGRNGIELLSFTSTEGIYGYFSSTNYFSWNSKHTDGGYDSCSGTYFYKLNENNQWELQVNQQKVPASNPSAGAYVLTNYNDIFFTNVDIYDSSSKTNVLVKGQSYPRQDYSIKTRPFEPPFEIPSVKEILAEDGAQHYFMMYCKADIYLVTIIPEVLEDFHIYQPGAYSYVYLYPSCRMTSVKYRRLNQSTLTWNSPSSYTNQTSFNSSFVYPTYSSTLNGAKVLNDMIIYTTVPVYLKRSTGTAPMTLARLADNQLVADENSIPPVVTDISFGTEEPYTVDSKFVFEPTYQLEELEGLMFAGAEFENAIPYYPPGQHTISARVKDSRGLWSDWFDKAFTVEPVIMPEFVNLSELPLKPDGAPYQHYLVSNYNGASSAYSLFCFAFDLKEDVEEFKPYVNNNNSTLYFGGVYARDLFKTAHYYEEYSATTGWGRGSYKEVNPGYTYLANGSSSRGIYSGLASYVYLSTFNIYNGLNSTTVRIHPINTPQFPLNIVAAASHENVWTSDDVTISYNIVLNGQTLDSVSYRVNDEERVAIDSNALSGEITFSETGDYRVEMIATNSEGYESKSEVFFKIDKTTPVLSIEEDDTQLIFTAVDNHSGIESIYYRLAEADVFTRSQNFAHHLAIALNETSEEEAISKNAWIKITSGYKLKKPVYGGVYTYELMAVDKVGNTHMVQHVYDLPKIPLQEIVVTPKQFNLSYNSTQALTVSYLPTNHNEEIQLTFESLNPDSISVTEKGYVRNIDPYFEGEAIIRISSGSVSTEVTVNNTITRIEYPSNYPSIYDLYNYVNEYSDFIIAKSYYGSNFHLYAFNCNDDNAVFYTKRLNYNNRICYSTDEAITEGKLFERNSNTEWKRTGTDLVLANRAIMNQEIASAYPHGCIVFSTVDFYADETGERLVRPKDVLPPMEFARVWLSPSDYDGRWVHSSYFNLHGEDGGSGLSKLTYSINNGNEIEIENGGTIVFPSSGIHTLQGFAYNDFGVKSSTEVIEVKLDLETPSISFEGTEDLESNQHQIQLSVQDEFSGIETIAYRINYGEWMDIPVEAGSLDFTQVIQEIPYYEHGTYYYDAKVTDIAGNESVNSFTYEVKKPVPSAIVVEPSSISLHPGESQELAITVEVLGEIEPDEIKVICPDGHLVRAEGHTIHTINVGETYVEVSCRGIYTRVPVSITPSFIDVKDFSVSALKSTLELFETTSFRTSFTPSNATDQTLKVEVLGESVKVEEMIVTPIKPGQSTIRFTSHNGITKEIVLTVLKPKEAPIVSNLQINPVSPVEGQEVSFTYDLWLDEERDATFRQERWIGKQDRYDVAGTYTVTLEVLDSNNLWSEPVSITFEVRPASNIRVKLNDRFVSLACSSEPTPVRFKASNGWCYLQTTNEPSPVRVKLNGEWVNIKIEE